MSPASVSEETVASSPRAPPAPAGALLAALPTATWVDETLLTVYNTPCVVAIRFGRANDPFCRACDAQLSRAAARLPALRAYTVDLDAVTEFTAMYELYDPCTVMFFHKGRPLLLDAGHGPVRSLVPPKTSTDAIQPLIERAVRAVLGEDEQSDASDALAGVVAETHQWLGNADEAVAERVRETQEWLGGLWQQATTQAETSYAEAAPAVSAAAAAALAAAESARGEAAKWLAVVQGADGSAGRST